MKKLLIAILILVAAVATQAQTLVFENCDKAVANKWFTDAFYNNQGSAVAKMDFSDFAGDKKEGAGSLKLDYTVGAGDGWGGYAVKVTSQYAQYLNISASSHLTFWYKVTKPVVMSQAGTAHMEFKIADVDEAGARDLWFREMPIDLADASGTWKQVSVDITRTLFKDGGDKTKEWALQFGDSDREAQLEKIKFFEFALVYITGGTATNTPTASGEILFDAFAVTGDAYPPPIFNFDNQATQFGLDDMGWAGATGKGEVKVSNEAADKVEGAGSLKMEYTVNASQDWGGFISIDKDVTPPAKFAERTGLTLWLKNVKAAVSTKPERLMLRFFIFEKSNGVDTEEWILKVPIDLTKVSDWTRYDIPFKQGTLPNGDQDPPTTAFGPKSNNGDKTFNPDKITKIRLEIFAAGMGPLAGTKGEKMTGTLLFDICQQSGYQLFDITKPSKPKNLSVIKGNFSNLISWGDVDNEGTETYHIYVSKTVITSLTAKGVAKVGQVARGVQVFEHLIKSPQTDKDVTWHYAVQAIDKNKNEGEIGTVGPITNKAKGIPTIAVATPNFKADGNLNEFAGIKPFQVKISNGTGFLTPNDKNNGDIDCSIEAAYVAIDKNFIYFGAEVNDDFVIDDPKYYPDNTWQADAVELFFGLYNLDEFPLTVNYKRGATPDYHLRFNKQKARSDHWDTEVDNFLLPGPNYYWAEKFPSGYVVEAKISIADLATKRDPNVTNPQIDKPYVKEGFRVMFDLGVFDADDLVANRKGRIFWTPTNNDQGYNNATMLGYTWIGNTDVISTDVEEEEMPVKYSLEQNYPNPFNPATQIKYSILNAGNVSLKVYDVLGREVADLVNKHQDAGYYTVNFNASALSSGIYFYRIESGSFVSVKKMMLVK
ncbi:MAG: 5'-nucleotidase [Ignavibacteria bacterium]|nr:MAG: 5'-nucleotidase [Ignavibacteria bacterium]KAF0158994.1 MAG: 5'-nucleotidase [Ignavibacteria bacterium]